MNYKQALAHARQLATLKRAGKLPPAISFPDLSVKPMPPTSDRFAKITYAKGIPEGAKSFPIQTLHKQGPMLLTPGDLRDPKSMAFSGGRKS